MGPAVPRYQALSKSCETGVAEGWLCQREAGGIRYGRIFKPADDLQGFSVDVVDMSDIAGPHHAHPMGEIDLIMPIDAAARLSITAAPAGWSARWQRPPAHGPRRTRRWCCTCCPKAGSSSAPETRLSPRARSTGRTPPSH